MHTAQRKATEPSKLTVTRFGEPRSVLVVVVVGVVRTILGGGDCRGEVSRVGTGYV